ncbi:uncharacterized protein LOC126888699 [Diabrotica virgifera virgifera]|uniref:Uncharacterized protein LOC114347252 n=1 Tax=Diabrotica virgifera virgifera TaxID=50390 RepID=A0A6P7H5F8_DIAVI|nr:uncharacterized protein LOC126888698 [Diabrotica virgifera virgifera]XP_050513030.1 uncharacterized protein LOC126888699 [Diabrotica virgifera virgifera]
MLTKLIQVITSILGLVRNNYQEDNVKKGLIECNKASKKLRDSMRYAKTMGEKQHLEAQMRQIITMRKQLKAEQKKGAGLNTRPETAYKRVQWDDSLSAFNSRIRTGVISNLKHKDPGSFLNDCKAIFKRRIQNALKNDAAVKVNTAFGGEFEIVQGEKVLNDTKYFTTSNSAIYRDTNLDEWFEEKVMEPITAKLEEFQERDSGWALKAVVNLGVNINKFTPQLGSSFVELPPQIKRKEACVNVKNDDEACFAWAVISALYPATKDPQRVSKYPHYSDVLKLKGIQFPMTIKQIPNFEKQNNISINVYILKKEKNNYVTLPTLLTKNTKDKHVNLLLIQDKYDEQGPIRYHYVWIKNLSRLLSKQLSREDGTKYFCDACLHYFRSQKKLNIHKTCCKGRSDLICNRCLQPFSSLKQLEAHTEDCVRINETAIKMPEESRKMLRFKNYKNKIKAPFAVYADLESALKRTGDPKKHQEHIPVAVGYFFKCSYDDTLSFYNSYRGKDCMKWFADELNQLAENVTTVFMCPYDINMTSQEESDFHVATHCHICEQRFSPSDKKVRDHDHMIPEHNYRGASHEGCNINYQDTHTIPVIFHNLSGYDAHFIVNDIATHIKGPVDLLPITKEKYISFTKHIDDARIKFRFIDSFRFMASSLDKLSSYLTEYPNLRSQFLSLSEENFNLLTKKGIMPYDYIDSFQKFNETCLPPQEAFYNKLEDKPCPRRHYRRAQDVWSSFSCSTLGDYIDLYMKTDILLLADVFEQFRSSCLKTYNLDPAHYFTLPGFTWDAMLKHTKQELELLTDPDMFLFVERGIRGGLSQVCSKRRVHANNKYMESYDPSKPDSYLMYFDVNNQYGWAMSQFLPYGGFEWVDANIDVLSIPDDSSEGYFLEVDLEYPQHIHDRHKDLPFCPQSLNPKTMLSPKRPREQTKLMATLHDKERYVIHYRTLKQALAHGLILKKIHRVLKFKQSPWLKSYIDLNTNLRKAAKNEFEKNLFKLMNNAVFGKTMENVRKRVDIKLLTEWEGRYGADARISSPLFKNATIFNENLVAVEMHRAVIWLDKPIYVGMSILDLAKTTIYDFHFGYLGRRFGENFTTCYTDTDSVIVEIREKDPYEAMKTDCHQHFDTSDYPKDNIYGIPQVNKKVLGMMKDENNGRIMTDYIGLRSKLYTTKVAITDNDIKQLRMKLIDQEYEDDEIDNIIRNYGVTKKAKGVKKSVVNSKITFEDYVECLDTSTTKIASQNLIRSDKHQVYSITQSKIALSPHDDKRYHLPESYDTLPWGHYLIENLEIDID